MCETKTVSTALYLDMNEQLAEDEHDYRFVGKAGSFCPIQPGKGGGILLREKEGKYYAATGTKGYRWLEAEAVKTLGKEDDIDHQYYISLVNAAIKDISKHGDFEMFVSDEPYFANDPPPWLMPCGDAKYENCFECPNLMQEAEAIYCGLGYDISHVILKGENHGKR